NAITQNDPDPLSQLNPAVPIALEELVGRMMQKDPALRPTATEVDAALSTLATESASVLTSKPAIAPRRWTVGRVDERAALRAAFDVVASGTGEMVCVVGEPGIGKTTLVEEFLTDLATDGQPRHIARARCSERLADAEAYLPVLEALDFLLHGTTASTA